METFKQITPQEWAGLFASSPEGIKASATPRLAEAVRAELSGLAGDMATTEMMEKLWPARYAKGEDANARKRMVNALLKLAHTDLKDWVRKAPTPIMRYGKPIYPWRWSMPVHTSAQPIEDEPAHDVTCPNCGQKFQPA